MKNFNSVDGVVNGVLEGLGYIIFKILCFIFKFVKVSVIFTITATFEEIKNIKTIYKKKSRRYLFFATIFISFLIIAYFLNIKFTWISIVLYFVIFGYINEAKKKYSKYKVNRYLKQLDRKYKEIKLRFDNKLYVVDEEPNKIILFSREMTLTQIKKDKEWFEMYFNRVIESINRCSDFKFYELVFLVKTSFQKYYKFQEYICKLNKKMELPILLGIEQNNNILVKDLIDIKYLFISGEAGGGKSVMINCILQGLMIYNHNTLYILVDFKEGIELSEYNKFNNSIIIQNNDQFSVIIKYIHDLMTDRLNKIKETEFCKNIHDYNNIYKDDKMYYIVFVIDEIAELKLAENKNKISDNEILLLRIMQKGRAAGIFGIGATQRPGSDQINTSIRAAFHYNISFKVSTKETQKMTKINDTENLKIGEFKTNIEPDNKIYKGFFISEQENKTKKIPLCNNTYLELYKKLGPDKLSKKLSGHEEIRQLIKYTSNDVISIVSELKKLSGINVSLEENQPLITTDKYQVYLKYIYSSKLPGGKLPTAGEIEKNVGISKTKRNELREKAFKEGYLIKKNERVFLINESADWGKK